MAEQLLLSAGQRFPSRIVGRRGAHASHGRRKQPRFDTVPRPGIVWLVRNCVGVVAGQQMKDDHGQAESVAVLGSVGVVTLGFRRLELGAPHAVGEGPAGAGIREPVGVAIHHGDVVLPVDLNILLVHVADNVAGLMDSAEAQGKVAGHADTVVDAEFAPLFLSGVLGSPAVVVVNDGFPGLARIQDGHSVTHGNFVLPDQMLGPGDVP